MQITQALIPELKKITYLPAGGNHIQALDSKGNAFSWGSGAQGQLADMQWTTIESKPLPHFRLAFEKRR